MAAPVASTTSQTFRSTSSSGSVFVININPRHDSKSGSKVILWNDVQRVFKHVQFIMHDGAAVSFLTDENFEDLIPLRIGFHPGVILDVVLEGSVSSPSSEEPFTFSSIVSPQPSIDNNSGPRGCHEPGEGSIPSPTSTPPISRQSSVDFKPQSSKFTSSNASTGPRHPQDRSLTSTPATSTSAGITITTISPQPIARAPAVILTESLSEIYLGSRPTIPPRPRSGMGDPWSSGGTTMEVVPRPPISSPLSIAGHYETSATSIESSSATYTYSTQSVTHQPGPQAIVEDGAMTSSPRMTDSSVRTGDMAITNPSGSHRKQFSSQQPQPVAITDDSGPSEQVKKKIESVMSLQYRLISAPAPRHFIVMPNRACLYDDKIIPTYDTFRLFFLCDCGDLGVHIAAHEGYNLDRAAEFFDQFGEYTLAMMQVFKYKVLSNQGSADSDRQYSAPIHYLAQKLKLDKDVIEHYMNLMISYLQKAQLEREEDGTAQEEIHEDGTPFLGSDRLEKLHSHLLGPNEKQKHGRDILAESTGLLDNSRPVVKREVSTADLYLTVDVDGYAHWMCLPHFKTRCLKFDPQRVYSWCRTFNGQYNPHWGSLEAQCKSPPSTEYLSELSNLNGIVSLAVDFSSHLYDQTMATMCDTVYKAKPAKLLLKFQSECFTHADMLAGCMDPVLTMLSSPYTQAFSFMGSQGGLMLERVMSQVALMRAPKLRYLMWNIDSISKEACLASRQGLYKLLSVCDNLEDLWIEWHWVDQIMPVMIFAKTAVATLWLLSKLTVFSRELEVTFAVKDGQLVRASQVRVSNLYRNLDVLTSGLLTELTITQRIYLYKTETRDMMLEIIRKNPRLEQLELDCWSGDLDETEVAIRTSLGGTCDAPHPTIKTLRIQSANDNHLISTVFDLTKKQSPEATALEITNREEDGEDDLDVIFLMYSASITKIVAGNWISGRLLGHLDAVACRPVTRLTHLDIGLVNIGDAGVKSLMNVIDRSPNLNVLRFACSNLGGPQTRKRALSMVVKYRSRLTGLSLSGASEHFWVEEFRSALPNLKALPAAKQVEVTCVKNPELSQAQLEWIKSMQTSPAVPVKN